MLIWASPVSFPSGFPADRPALKQACRDTFTGLLRYTHPLRNYTSSLNPRPRQIDHIGISGPHFPSYDFHRLDVVPSGASVSIIVR